LILPFKSGSAMEMQSGSYSAGTANVNPEGMAFLQQKKITNNLTPKG